MNYCSLQDAWGNNHSIGKQYKKYMVAKQDKTIESFTDVEDTKEEFKEEVKEKPIEQKRIVIQKPCSVTDCNDIISHIKHCKKCQKKMKYLFKPKILDNVNEMIDDNKDVIVLILFGISIALFFKLVNNITK